MASKYVRESRFTHAVAGEPKRILLIRFSSLGDVILATTAVEILSSNLEIAHKVDFLTDLRFSEYFTNYSKINQLWIFEKLGKSRFLLQVLARQLSQQNYDFVIDLHGSIRSRYVCYLLRKFSKKSGTVFSRLPKNKARDWAYFTLKNFLPVALRPKPVRKRILEQLKKLGFAPNSQTQFKPNASHLLFSSKNKTVALGESSNIQVGIMPSSKWGSKSWTLEGWVRIVEQMNVSPHVFGTKSDRQSLDLIEALNARNISVVSHIGEDLVKVAMSISQLSLLLSVDTGLSHLAEALGVKVAVFFGPTTPSLGFGPLLPSSTVIQSDLNLWCRPCSKDGRHCYRPFQKYRCMTSISESTTGLVQVLKYVEESKKDNFTTGKVNV